MSNEPQHIRDPRDLIELARSRKDGQSQEKLDYDTAEGPHVDRCRVRQTEKDLWRSVESRLDVGVDCLPFVTGRTKVDHLDLRRVEAIKSEAQSFC